MSQCQQARMLLTQIKTLQEQLFSSNQELLESRIPTSPTASFGTGKHSDFAQASPDRQEAREQLYEQIRNTNIAIQNTIEQLESMLYVSEQAAEKIMREKKLFLGPEAVQALFDVKLEPADIPVIPFSKKELEKTAELGSVLMLVIKQDKDGNLLTAKRIGEVTYEKLKTVDPAFQKLFYRTDWYQDEPFYTTNLPLTSLQEKTAPAQWILVSRETLPNSKNKNFLEQTFLLAKHLEDNILSQIKNNHRRQPYLAALAELEAKRASLEAKSELFTLDAWNKLTDEQKISLAKLLTTLKINQLTRPDFATMIYLQAMYLKNYHQYLLTNEYTWVNETSAMYPRRLVDVGSFDRSGVAVVRWYPVDRDDGLGVSFLSSL